MGDEAHTTESNVPNADGPDDLKELESMIAADEAELNQRREQGRNGKGQYQSASANNGQRAGQRLTPEEVSAAAARRTADAGAGDNKPAPAPGSDEGGDGKDGDTKDGKADAAAADAGKGGKGDENLTPYQKAKRRESEAWKKINEEKAQLELERKALESERLAVRRRPPAAAAAAPARDEAGYTRAQYVEYAGRWEQNAGRLEQEAKAAEQEGDFDKADRLTAQAEKERGLAVAARERARGMPAGAGNSQSQTADSQADSQGQADEESAHRRAWATVRVDLPEALVAGSALNKALIDYIQGNGAVLQQPDGVYRAVIQVGRQMVSKLEREAARAQELEKANGALTEKIKGLEAEMQRLTSLPGGDATNRGGGRKFGDLSTTEMQRELEGELAGHL